MAGTVYEFNVSFDFYYVHYRESFSQFEEAGLYQQDFSKA